MKITNRIKLTVLNAFESKGYVLLKKKELEKKVDYFKKILLQSKSIKHENKIDSIVFSKDRAMQLHAFLCSYISMVSDRGTIFILYKTSNDRHARSYEQLRELFKHENFVFISETDFRGQLIEISLKSNAKIIGTYVDDMIFLRPVDYGKILNINALENIVTLGRGKEMDYSVVLEKKMQTPFFEQMPDGFEYFRWDYTDEYNDWTYPIGVGGYFFDRDEWLIMLQGINFKAPNSLENNLQVYKPVFIHRNGVCMDQICCVAVHANLVQSESVNPDLGTFSIDSLLSKWEEGLAIDLGKFYGISGSVAQLQSYEFYKR